MGLVNTVVPFDRLEDETVAWAEKMMEHSPLALRMIKAGLNAELDGQAGIQELAGDATMLYYMTEEAQEGGKHFWKNASHGSRIIRSSHNQWFIFPVEDNPIVLLASH